MSNHNACALIMNKRINPLPWGLIYQPYLVHKKNKANRETRFSHALCYLPGVSLRAVRTMRELVKWELYGDRTEPSRWGQGKSQRKSA